MPGPDYPYKRDFDEPAESLGRQPTEATHYELNPAYAVTDPAAVDPEDPEEPEEPEGEEGEGMQMQGFMAPSGDETDLDTTPGDPDEGEAEPDGEGGEVTDAAQESDGDPAEPDAPHTSGH